MSAEWEGLPAIKKYQTNNYRNNYEGLTFGDFIDKFTHTVYFFNYIITHKVYNNFL